jgi:hypothetical protein
MATSYQEGLFKEVHRILKRFWLSFVLSFTVVFAMIILSTPLVPPEWQIPGSNWAVVFPMALTLGCHILYPVRDFSFSILRWSDLYAVVRSFLTLGS